MIVLIKILQLVLALSLLILVHELGHFLFAKLFGIRVDKFYLFFDVGGFSLFHFKIGETEYGMGWLPLGGYCKISGMIDESMDTDYLKKEPQPWEFRSKPAWQRLLVMFGGVLFNFMFAIAIYTGIIASQGQTFISNEGNCIYASELAREMGFKTGDRILRYDDFVPESFYELQSDLVRRSVRVASVLRDSDTINIYIDASMAGRVLNTPGMFELALPFVVDSVATGSPNALSGLVRGDRITAFDGHAVRFVQDARPVLLQKAGMVSIASVQRDSARFELPLQVDTAGRIGVFMQMPGLTHKDYSLAAAVPAGLKYTLGMVADYVRDLKLVATPSTGAYKSVGSFIAIGQVFPDRWDWLEFAVLLGLLSIMLAVMNLIPIPGLDGGHIMFTIFEMITGRKPSDKFMMAAQMVGMVLLLLLMFLAFGNDIGRLMK